MSGRIVLLEGDIVLGAGVAGAIARAGGPSIQAECDAHGPVAVGEAAITGAGDLPARFVIHAASMPPGGRASEESVRDAMRATLALAEANGCETLAVPAIGAGVAGFPLQRCAEILIEEARTHLAGADGNGQGRALREVRFVLFGEPAYRVFEMVDDAARVAEQMARLAKRRGAPGPDGSGGPEGAGGAC